MIPSPFTHPEPAKTPDTAHSFAYAIQALAKMLDDALTEIDRLRATITRLEATQHPEDVTTTRWSSPGGSGWPGRPPTDSVPLESESEGSP